MLERVRMSLEDGEETAWAWMLLSCYVGSPGARKARMELWVRGVAPHSLCLVSSPRTGASNVQKLFLVCQEALGYSHKKERI